MCIRDRYIGTVSVVNAMDKIIDAFKFINDNEIELWIIGDGKCKNALVRQVRDEGISNVRFFKPVSQKCVPEYLSIADLCVISGKSIKVSEAIFPNKLFDYFAAGKPVIVNFTGVSKDVILENNCGVFVKPDDPKGFAIEIIKLKNESQRLREMGINARKLAEDKFDREKLAVKFIEVLESVHNNHVSHLRERHFNL